MILNNIEDGKEYQKIFNLEKKIKSQEHLNFDLINFS